MLGRDLVAAAPADVNLCSLSRDRLDVTITQAVFATLDALRPDIVINASGYTAVDRAEIDRASAFAVNASAVDTLASACAQRDIMVVHFSTDYVFDGSASQPYAEGSPPNPINQYGESKLAGERALVSSGARHLLIRTQWLFGTGGRSFARMMWQRASLQQATRVVDDQRGRPTFSLDVASATWKLIQRDTVGLVHVANSGDASWYEVAARIFSDEGVIDRLGSCKTSDLARPARRPSYSVLDTKRADVALGSPLRHWSEALGAFVQALGARDGSREQ